MFRSILIPIDHYSPHTDAAVAPAVKLAKLTGAAIHVVPAEEGISGTDSQALGSARFRNYIKRL
jgi:nucleotide-binding universal stress UspA family protein